MKVKILNKQHFSAKPNQSIEILNNADDIVITLPFKKLVFSTKATEIAKYEAEHNIEFEEYEDRIICYLRNDHVKRISFEVFGDTEQLKEFKKLLIQRNNIVSYKSPLYKDCSIKLQDSMLTDKNRELNIKGFINLALIFVFLNYVVLIAESRTEERLVFIDNVK